MPYIALQAYVWPVSQHLMADLVTFSRHLAALLCT